MNHRQGRRSFLPAGIEASAESLDRLAEFERMLRIWNRSINLVSRSSLEDCRRRHFQDSAQLFRYRPCGAGSWLDLGSGGGFPGIVLACLGVKQWHETRFVLVESNRKKHLFLSTVIRNLEINAVALRARVEEIDPCHADVVSARALAPLSDLLGYADRHLASNGLCVFPKGKQFEAEITAATESWRFELQRKPSATSSSSAILLIRRIRSRQGESKSKPQYSAVVRDNG